ncbi:MAG: beta-ketoacyl-[acyl-carrier-protein] synthase II, partial [Candidatus Eremiobacteraeota bacterium]|nr:beta-ketoacyl-[acyl-carrier-protein] synthase II [Candidatus Eremiobacteraeota bacterium]
MEKRRVVVTGLGAVTPLGNTREAYWEGLITGRSGVGPITAFDAAKLSTRIAAEVKDFDADALIGRRDARRMDRYAQFALVAAREATADAAFPEDPDVRERTGAIVASGIGGIITVEKTTIDAGT